MKITKMLLALGTLIAIESSLAQGAPIPRGPQDRPSPAPPRGSRALLDQEALERRQQFLQQNQRRIDRETQRRAPESPRRQMQESLRPDGHSWD